MLVSWFKKKSLATLHFEKWILQPGFTDAFCQGKSKVFWNKIYHYMFTLAQIKNNLN